MIFLNEVMCPPLSYMTGRLQHHLESKGRYSSSKEEQISTGFLKYFISKMSRPVNNGHKCTGSGLGTGYIVPRTIDRSSYFSN